MTDRRINDLGRLLTTILRHRAMELGLRMAPDGFVPMHQLLALGLRTRSGVPLRGHNSADVVRAVAEDSKQRMSVRGEGRHMEIRANQGHSVSAVSDDALLRPILSPLDLPVPGLCVHGTYFEALPSILRTGLQTMGRRHVHFSTRPYRSTQAISGMRWNCEVLVYLDVEAALQAGIKIYLSSNEVALVPQTVPPSCFLKVCGAGDGGPCGLPWAAVE